MGFRFVLECVGGLHPLSMDTKNKSTVSRKRRNCALVFLGFLAADLTSRFWAPQPCNHMNWFFEISPAPYFFLIYLCIQPPYSLPHTPLFRSEVVTGWPHPQQPNLGLPPPCLFPGDNRGQNFWKWRPSPKLILVFFFLASQHRHSFSFSVKAFFSHSFFPPRRNCAADKH